MPDILRMPSLFPRRPSPPPAHLKIGGELNAGAAWHTCGVCLSGHAPQGPRRRLDRFARLRSRSFISVAPSNLVPVTGVLYALCSLPPLALFLRQELLRVASALVSTENSGKWKSFPSCSRRPKKSRPPGSPSVRWFLRSQSDSWLRSMAAESSSGGQPQFPFGMRVLIVDDDVISLKALEFLLLRCGYLGMLLLVDFCWAYATFGFDILVVSFDSWFLFLDVSVLFLFLFLLDVEGFCCPGSGFDLLFVYVV